MSNPFSHPLSPATSIQCDIRERQEQLAKPSDKLTCAIGFEFVNVTHPSNAKDTSSRRAVRSHVARLQHNKDRVSASATRKLRRQTSEPGVGQSSARGGTRQRQNIKSEETDTVISNECRGKGTSLDDNSLATEVRYDRWRPPYPHSRSSVSPSIRGGHEPFWTYPVPFHPFLETIVDHYLKHIAVDNPDIDSPDQKGLLRSRWFPLCMTEPASFYATMLVAASHFDAMFRPALPTINIMVLKDCAIKAINESLRNTVGCTTDQLVGAVMKMASYEAVFGDKETYRAHMGGLQQMVQLRGGLPKLGLDGLLERMVLWTDCNAAHLLGLPWTFQKELFPTTAVHPAPDLMLFAGRSDSHEENGPANNSEGGNRS